MLWPLWHCPCMPTHDDLPIHMDKLQCAASAAMRKPGQACAGASLGCSQSTRQLVECNEQMAQPGIAVSLPRTHAPSQLRRHSTAAWHGRNRFAATEMIAVSLEPVCGSMVGLRRNGLSSVCTVPTFAIRKHGICVLHLEFLCRMSVTAHFRALLIPRMRM